MQGYGDDDYLVFDCPGQIELYSHVTAFRSLVDYLKNDGWRVCAVYCLDSQFISEAPKFIAGSLQALAAMVHLELPHVNVLTKVDLCEDKVIHQFLLSASDAMLLYCWRETFARVQQHLEDILFPDVRGLAEGLQESTGPRFRHLNQAVGFTLVATKMPPVTYPVPCKMRVTHRLSCITGRRACG